MPEKDKEFDIISYCQNTQHKFYETHKLVSIIDDNCEGSIMYIFFDTEINEYQVAISNDKKKIWDNFKPLFSCENIDDLAKHIKKLLEKKLNPSSNEDYDMIVYNCYTYGRQAYRFIDKNFSIMSRLNVEQGFMLCGHPNPVRRITIRIKSKNKKESVETKRLLLTSKICYSDDEDDPEIKEIEYENCAEYHDRRDKYDRSLDEMIKQIQSYAIVKMNEQIQLVKEKSLQAKRLEQEKITKLREQQFEEEYQRVVGNNPKYFDSPNETLSSTKDSDNTKLKKSGSKK